jgi:hypothetical protein
VAADGAGTTGVLASGAADGTAVSVAVSSPSSAAAAKASVSIGCPVVPSIMTTITWGGAVAGVVVGARVVGIGAVSTAPADSVKSSAAGSRVGT